MDLADRVVVLRDGKNAGILKWDEIDHDSIVKLMVGRDIERWGASPHATPLPARIAGAVSLLVWIGVVACGRWVGFTLHPTALGG